MIDRLKAYRARLLKAGRLLEARAVDRCIEIAAASSESKVSRGGNIASEYSH